MDATLGNPKESPPAPERGEWLLLAGIFLLATAVRFLNLDETSLWIDEIYTFVVANGHLEATDIRVSVEPASYYYERLVAWRPLEFDTLLSLLKSNVHMPLYYLLINPWLGMAGNDAVGLRSFSALCSVLTVIPMFLLGRSLAGTRAGLLAAFAMAVNPYQIYFAQEGRMYALLTLWAAWATLALWKTLHAERPFKWSLLYALTVVFGVLTHYMFAFFLGFHALFGLIWLARERRKRFWLLGIAVLAVLAVAAWWYPIYQIQQQGVNEEYHFAKSYVSWYRYLVVFVWQPLVTVAGDNALLRLFYMPLVIGLLVIRLIVLRKRGIGLEFSRDGFLLLWVFAPLLIQVLYDVVQETHTSVIDRYVLLISPGMILWLGLALHRTWQGAERIPALGLFKTLLVTMGVLAFAMVWADSPFRDEHNKKPIHRKIDHFLRHADENALVFANGPYGVPGLAAYYLVKKGHGDQPMIYWINKHGNNVFDLPEPGEINQYGTVWLFRYRANNERGLQTAKEYIQSLYPRREEREDWFIFSRE